VIITEELLMAYADGELDGAEHATDRARIEAAMRADPDVARRIEKHRALRRELNATFDGVLDEPVPDRLIAAIRGSRAESNRGGEQRETARAPDDLASSTPSAAAPPGASGGVDPAEPATRRTASISDLTAARAAKAESVERARRARASWSWPQWGAMAASLVVGAIIGHVALKSPELSSIASRGGHLVAEGGLAEALSNQLASTQPANAPVQIGTSFKAKDGAYCRTFILHEGDPVGGLACRAGNAWNVHTLARAENTPGSDGGYRPAGSEMPAAVRDAVEDQIVGDPLDSSAEAQAKKSGWK
jgi:anti-sigma factor RsiW